MERAGQIGRFLDHYVRRYLEHGFILTILSYGARASERRVLDRHGLEQVEVCAPRRQRGWGWCVPAVLRCHRQLRAAHVWRNLHATGALPSIWFRAFGRTRVATNYGYDYELFSREEGHRVRSRLLPLLVRTSFRCADVILVTSQQMAELARRKGASPEKLALVPNAAPLAQSRTPARSRHGVLWVGRASGQKRLDVAVAAVERAGVDLTVVARGELDSDLGRRLREIGATRIDALPHAELMEAMDRAAILLMTSDYEGTPKVMLEGMARGAAVLVPDIPELGWVTCRIPPVVAVFRPGDVADCADSLSRLFYDPERREALGRAAYDYVAQEADIAVVIRQEVEILASLAANGAR